MNMVLNGQSCLHGRGLDGSSVLRDPVKAENRSQQTIDAGDPR